MRRIQCSLALLACLGLLFTPGCTAPSSAQIIDGINKAGPTVIYDILKEVPAQDTAKKDAQFISTAITIDILPFVKNNTLPAATFLPQLKKLLGSKITNTAYYGAVSAVITLATLNVDLTAPAMTTDETAYIVASLAAIKTGCDAFVTGSIVDNSLYDVHKEHQQCMARNLKNPAFRARLTTSQIAAESEENNDGTCNNSKCTPAVRGGSCRIGRNGQCIKSNPDANASWEDVRK